MKSPHYHPLQTCGSMLWNWESQRTQYSTVILASLHRWINQTNDHYFVFQIINLWSIGPREQMIRELSNQALVKLFLDLQEKHCRGQIQASVRPADVVHTIQVIYNSHKIKSFPFTNCCYFLAAPGWPPLKCWPPRDCSCVQEATGELG